MTARVTLTHEYPYPSDLVWFVATDLEHLETVMKGLISFRGLPEGQIYERQHINVYVSLFGFFPYQPYEMTVLECDHDTRRFVSSEKGAGVKSWRHTLQITPTPNGCRIDETIEIDAGRLTSLFARWARFLYQKRHKPRLKILADLSAV